MRNISSKDLGAASRSGRITKAVITTQCRQLVLSNGPQINHCEFPVQVLPGKGRVNLSFSAKFLQTTIPYETASAEIALHLTPPDKSAACSIQAQKLSIKVSNAYTYNPQSDVLLVTNYNTTANDIRSWNSLICNQLKMKLDVYNLSANGSLQTVLPDGVSKHLFSLYQGKIIEKETNNIIHIRNCINRNTL